MAGRREPPADILTPVSDAGTVAPAARSDRRRLAIDVAIGLAVALVAAPTFGVIPGPGLDPSWQAALHMAARHDLAFGRDIAFTYGPLGFLSIPRLYSSLTGGLAFAFTVAVHLLTSIAVVLAARRRFGLLGSALVGYALMRLLAELSPSEQVLIPYFVGCVAVVRRALPRRLLALAPWILGAAAGIALLIKVNTGIVMGLLAGVALLVPLTPLARLLRREAALGAASAAAILLGWLLTGQPISALDEYVLNALDASSGYASAMVVEEAGRGDEYRLALVCGLVLLGLAVAAFRPRLRSRDDVARVAVAVGLVVVLLFAVFKHGFVRHDGHASIFFAVVAGCAIAFPLGRRRVAAFVACLAFLIGAGLQASVPRPISALLHPPTASFLRQAATVLVPSRRADAMASAREAMRANYGLKPDTVEQLSRGGVDVQPWEQAVVWAYGLPWQPAPTLQTYAAYTPNLDELDGEHFTGSDRPRWVLREQIPISVDNRNADFEAPKATLALVCGYRQAAIDGRWQVLERGRDRCGTPRVIGTAPIREGVRVKVPEAPPGSLLLARIRFDSSPLDALGTFAYRGPQSYITVDGRSHRLVTATAGDGLLVRAPADLLGLDPAFGLTPQISELSVEQTPGALEGEVEFVAIPVER